MYTTLPFSRDPFLPSAQYKSHRPSLLIQSDCDVQILAPPATQFVSQACDLDSPNSLSSDVATPSPPSSAAVCLKGGGRRGNPNHVPRPLNCFFLFKADWLAKRKSLLAGVEQDHRQLNRMASSEWRKLPQEVKQRFKEAAHKAKVEHAMRYPEYRFTPKPRGDRRRRRTKRNEPEVLLRNEEAARLVSQGVTGDALLEALADYDQRATAERHPMCRAASPPPFSEALTSTSPSFAPPSPSVYAYSSPDLAMQPSGLLERGTPPTDSHPVRGVVQHAPFVDDIPAIPAEPAGDPYSLHFDYFSSGNSTTSIPQPRGLSNQFRQTGDTGHENDWSYQSAFPVDETQGAVPGLAYPSFRTDSDLVQATHTAIPSNPWNCWNSFALQQDLFPSHDLTNSLNFTFICTSGGGSRVPGDSQAPFLHVLEPTYHRPAFSSDPALFDLNAAGLDLDPTVVAD
ncbi:hypothetical protein EI94DRAFT_1718454 [Lactarius quietus]|nr:hypothetical protein EI94DRAFT_1718454 [Lactarius quietus]